MKLAILATHPIQYYAPLFKQLSNSELLSIRVYYGWVGMTKVNTDPGFGTAFSWDVPLLDGYEFEFLKNKSRQPGSHHFNGIDCYETIKRISEWDPQAIMVYGWGYRSHLKALRYFKRRIPVLFRGDSTLLDPLPLWRRIARRIRLRSVYKSVDYALYVGSNNKDYFLDCGLTEKQLVFAPHSVDNERFRPSKEAKINGLSFRRSLGIPDQHRLILFVGKLEPKKCPLMLYDAFQTVYRRNASEYYGSSSGVSLVFVGAGPLLEELKGRHGKHVYVAGFRNQNELPGIYASADLVVLPSAGPGETWGLTINEAMASGCAVATSDRVGCARDLVFDKLNGWTFSAGNMIGLEYILDAFVKTSTHDLQIMKANSLDRIANWSYGSQIKAIENLCRNL